MLAGDHTDVYASVLLEAIAREEASGRRAARLTEAGQATWQRFRGRLGSADFLRLLAEDAAVVHALPFAASRVGVSLDGLRDDVVDRFISDLPNADLTRSSAAYIEAQARRLGLPTKLTRSDLHQVKVHQKVLELPGTGGQLCHHLVSTQPDLKLQVNCTIACGTWAELALAGIVALDLGAPNSDTIVATTADELKKNDKHPLRQQRFDFVVGLKPEKGGKFVAADELELWFHGAKLLFV